MLNKMRLLTPGPTPIPERVRLAMAKDMIHHRKDAFKEIMAQAQIKMGMLFGTEEPVLPLSCSGTGAMTAAIHGLFNPKDKVLIINGGKFSERWGEIATTHGLICTKLTVDWGNAIQAEDVENALNADKSIKAVLMQHSETSTGVLHPVQEVAKITSKRDVLLIVDGISAVGICPCPMDEWGIDCLLTGSQKGLMVPPGLALLALSKRAWKVAEGIKSTCFYFNLLKERNNILKNQTSFTSPVSLLIGLAESLEMIFENSLDLIYRKQWALTLMARAGANAIGLELFAKTNFAWGVTSIILPNGTDGTKLIKIAQEKYGVYIAGGQDHLKGRMLRIGHMGYVDYADLAAGLHAIAMSLREIGGYTASRNYLEQSLATYHTALTVPPGQNIPEIGGTI